MACLCDCCGLCTSIFVWILALFGAYTIVFQLVLTSLWTFGTKVALLIAFGSVTVMCLWTHLMTVMSSPGYLPLGDEDKEREGAESRASLLVEDCLVDNTPRHEIQEIDSKMRWCRKCKNYKSPRAHHCSVCMRCVVKMDHHCPWVNNCIGIYNQKHFMLFNLYSALMSILGFSVVIARLAHCSVYDELKAAQQSLAASSNFMRALHGRLYHDPLADIRAEAMRAPSAVVHSIGRRPSNNESCGITIIGTVCMLFTGMEALVLGIFTVVILVEQIRLAAQGLSGIDTLKRDKGAVEAQGPTKSSKENFRDAVGHSFGIQWFCPLAVKAEAVEKGVTELDRLCLSGSYVPPLVAEASPGCEAVRSAASSDSNATKRNAPGAELV